MPNNPNRQEIDVEFKTPSPSPMFTAWQHRITRFVTFTRPVPCAYCGKPRRHHWTRLTFFRVMDTDLATPTASATEYPPLTPVCVHHVLDDIYSPPPRRREGDNKLGPKKRP